MPVIPENFTEIEPQSSNKIIDDLLLYMENKLPDFINSSEVSSILISKKNENQHSLALCVYMTNQCQSTFYFARENAQLASSTIDIGIYFGSLLVFTIEAKILPKPKEYKEAPIHDYVYTEKNNGGVQRFKEVKHGLDNENKPLRESGMIAYIKENNFDFWLKEINQWIVQASWSNSEKLDKIYFESIARLLSKHSRQTQQPNTPDITLHHFWVYVR